MNMWREKMRHLFRRENGFTIGEILLTIVIIGILTAIAVPVFLAQKQRSNDATLQSEIVSAMTKVEQSRAAFGGKYPTTLTPSNKPPIAAPGASGVVFAYTYPYDRTDYCLQATFKGKSLFVSARSTTPSTANCTFTFVIPAPENFYAEANASGVPTARWDKVEGATSYNVYKNNVRVVTGTTALTATLAQMTPGTSAEFWVRAVNASGQETPNSNKVTVNIPIPAPQSAPVLTSVQTANNGPAMTVTHRLSWTVPEWTTRYNLYDADTDAIIYSGTATTYNVDVEKSKTKRFYVIPANDSGVGPKSNVLTIAPVFNQPVLTATVDDFTLKADFSWDGLTNTWGTGATAQVRIPADNYNGPVVTTDTWSNTIDRTTKAWTVRITTGNGVVLDSVPVTLAPKPIPALDVTLEPQTQRLSYAMTNTPASYGLTSSNSRWSVEISDNPSFTKTYQQSITQSINPATPSIWARTPAHGGTYYFRYIVERTTDGAKLTSSTQTTDLPTRSFDYLHNNIRDQISLDIPHASTSFIFTPLYSKGDLNVANAVIEPRVIGDGCRFYPILDFIEQGSQGVLCWHTNGYLYYYAVRDDGFVEPAVSAGSGWNMYEEVMVIQNFWGDDRPAILAYTAADGTWGPAGTLQAWHTLPGGTITGVDRTAGSGWHHTSGAGISAMTPMYDWNGYGQVGWIASATKSPWLRYYGSRKDPSLSGGGNIIAGVSLNATWEATVNTNFPKTAHPNNKGSYQYARYWPNIVRNGKTVPVIAYGPNPYADAVVGSGSGTFSEFGPDWGYTNKSGMEYPGQDEPIG